MQITEDKNLNGANSAESSPELEEMFRAGVHFGYARSRRHPKMKDYIFGIRNNVEVFELSQVKAKLDKALDFVRKLGESGKTVVFVGTKPSVKETVEKMAREISMPFVEDRWLGGTLTNFTALRKRMDYFDNLRQEKASGGFEKYTKKERLNLDKEMSKLEGHFGGILTLKKMPDAVLVVDAKAEKVAVAEAHNKHIPVIAIMNSDSDPSDVDYPIPANDSSHSSVAYLLAAIAKAYQEGVRSASAKTEQAK